MGGGDETSGGDVARPLPLSTLGSLVASVVVEVETASEATLFPREGVAPSWLRIRSDTVPVREGVVGVRRGEVYASPRFWWGANLALSSGQYERIR